MFFMRPSYAGGFHSPSFQVLKFQVSRGVRRNLSTRERGHSCRLGHLARPLAGKNVRAPVPTNGGCTRLPLAHPPKLSVAGARLTRSAGLSLAAFNRIASPGKGAWPSGCRDVRQVMLPPKFAAPLSIADCYGRFPCRTRSTSDRSCSVNAALLLHVGALTFLSACGNRVLRWADKNVVAPPRPARSRTALDGPQSDRKSVV